MLSLFPHQATPVLPTINPTSHPKYQYRSNGDMNNKLSKAQPLTYVLKIQFCITTSSQRPSLRRSNGDMNNELSKAQPLTYALKIQLCITTSSQRPSLRISLASLCTKTWNILGNPEDKAFLSSVLDLVGGWVGVVGGRETDRKGQEILPQIVPILFKT